MCHMVPTQEDATTKILQEVTLARCLDLIKLSLTDRKFKDLSIQEIRFTIDSQRYGWFRGTDIHVCHHVRVELSCQLLDLDAKIMEILSRRGCEVEQSSDQGWL